MEKVKITCPYCKQEFAIKKPEKPGVYRMVCPNATCKKDIRLKLVARPIQMERQGDREQEATVSNRVIRPIQMERQEDREQEATDKVQKKTVPANQDPPTKTKITPKEEFKLHKAQLIQQRKFKANIVHRLAEGKNLIGRKDDIKSSDISIEGDNTISRQSVEIVVERTEEGYLFKLNVLHATNPVYLNKMQLSTGEGMYLDYGDIIKLGKSTFIFDECKN